MILLKCIHFGEKRYGFFHDSNSDARYLKDSDGDTLLIIDANLNVIARDGRFGTIEGDTNWTLYYGPIRTRFDTGVSYANGSWRALETAEVEVCRFYLQHAMLPKFKRTETEGGTCD